MSTDADPILRTVIAVWQTQTAARWPVAATDPVGTGLEAIASVQPSSRGHRPTAAARIRWLRGDTSRLRRRRPVYDLLLDWGMDPEQARGVCAMLLGTIRLDAAYDPEQHGSALLVRLHPAAPPATAATVRPRTCAASPRRTTSTSGSSGTVGGRGRLGRGALVRVPDGDGGSWPTIATLATYAGGVSQRSVQRAISDLVALGEVAVHDQAGGLRATRNDRRPNLYRVLLHCPVECDRTTNHRPTRGDTHVTPSLAHGMTPVTRTG